MDKSRAKTIIQNAVEITKPRWSQYDEYWNNIDYIFIYRGYEQQGLQLFKLRPVMEKLNIFSIHDLGNLLLIYPNKKNYSREFAGSLTTEFYSDLQKGVCGSAGELFVEAIRTFLDKKMGNPGRTFWKLLYHLLQGCAFLKQNYSSSFGIYVISKYASFKNRQSISVDEFLKLTVSEWEIFLAKAKPWKDIMGIGPNVFDFLFGDIVEAQFVVNSYKFDSSNQHFFNATGISQLIIPFDRAATTLFLKDLEMPFSLREINKGIYTYCSKTESAEYGYCRDCSKCSYCKVNAFCDKKIQHFDTNEEIMLGTQKPRKPNKTNFISTGKHKPSNGLPQLFKTTTFGELSNIIRIRSNRIPTKYMDLLLLENENKKLSDIQILFHNHCPDSNDFENVPRIRGHITWRENHDGWRFSYAGDPENPIVKLIGLK